MNDYVKMESRGKGAGLEKYGYVLGATVAIYVFTSSEFPLADRRSPESLYFLVLLLFTLFAGILCTCCAKSRRVSRDYVEFAKDTKRVKEKLEISDDEEDSDCDIDHSNMGDYKQTQRARGKPLRKKCSILSSQIENLIVHDPMYAFLLFGHLVSKCIDHSILFTYVCWFGSADLGEQEISNAIRTLMTAMLVSCVMMLIFGKVSDRTGF